MPIPAEDDPVVATLAGELDSLSEEDGQLLRQVLRLFTSSLAEMERRMLTLEEKLGPPHPPGKTQAQTSPAGDDG